MQGVSYIPKLTTSKEEEATPLWAQISEGQGEGVCSGLENRLQCHIRSWQVVPALGTS